MAYLTASNANDLTLREAFFYGNRPGLVLFLSFSVQNVKTIYEFNLDDTTMRRWWDFYMESRQQKPFWRSLLFVVYFSFFFFLGKASLEKNLSIQRHLWRWIDIVRTHTAHTDWNDGASFMTSFCWIFIYMATLTMPPPSYNNNIFGWIWWSCSDNELQRRRRRRRRKREGKKR